MDEKLSEPNQPLIHDPKDAAWQAQLVTRCLQGDEQAFTLIVDTYGGLLLRTAYVLVHDEESAKDIVQEGLLLAWKNMHQLHEPSSLRAWLIKIVINQSSSLKRQLAHKASLLQQQFLQKHLDSAMQVADMQRGHIEETLDMWQAIDQLPLKQRVVLLLFYYHRMTMPEIANTLGVSENTLRKRLQAALVKVRKMLRSDGATAKEQNSAPDTVSLGIKYSGRTHHE